jgi:hypothetical protein
MTTNTAEELIKKAKDAEKRFNTARDELAQLREELRKAAGTSLLTDAQKRDALRIARKGAPRRRRRR